MKIDAFLRFSDIKFARVALKSIGIASAGIALYQAFFPNDVAEAWDKFNDAYCDYEELVIAGKVITGIRLENKIEYKKYNGIAGGQPFVEVKKYETKSLRFHVEGESKDRVYEIEKKESLYSYYNGYEIGS